MLPSTARPRHTIPAGPFHLTRRSLNGTGHARNFGHKCFISSHLAATLHFQRSIPNSSGCPAPPRWHIPPDTFKGRLAGEFHFVAAQLCSFWTLFGNGSAWKRRGTRQHREENGRQGREKGERREGEGKAEGGRGPGSPRPLSRLRGDPRARGLASPPKPAPAPAPPPLTGCRRPRSARRARCWGAAGSGTSSAAAGADGRKERREGEEGGEERARPGRGGSG